MLTALQAGPSPTGRVVGRGPAGHGELRRLGLTASEERALALVYAAAIGGWSHLVGWGVLHATDTGAAQQRGGLIGRAAAPAVSIAVARVAAHFAEQALVTVRPAGAASTLVNRP